MSTPTQVSSYPHVLCRVGLGALQARHTWKDQRADLCSLAFLLVPSRGGPADTQRLARGVGMGLTGNRVRAVWPSDFPVTQTR